MHGKRKDETNRTWEWKKPLTLEQCSKFRPEKVSGPTEWSHWHKAVYRVILSPGIHPSSLELDQDIIANTAFLALAICTLNISVTDY